MATYNPDSIVTKDNMLEHTVGIHYNNHMVVLPKGVFEDKADVCELIQLGLEKKAAIEKLVKEKWAERERETEEAMAQARKAAQVSGLGQVQADTARLQQQQYDRAYGRMPQQFDAKTIGGLFD